MNSYCVLFNSKLVFFRPQDQFPNGSGEYTLAGVIDVRFDVTDPCLLESTFKRDRLQFSVDLAGSRGTARRMVFAENRSSETSIREWAQRLAACVRQDQPTSRGRNSFLLSPVGPDTLYAN